MLGTATSTELYDSIVRRLERCTTMHDVLQVAPSIVTIDELKSFLFARLDASFQPHKSITPSPTPHAVQHPLHHNHGPSKKRIVTNNDITGDSYHLLHPAHESAEFRLDAHPPHQSPLQSHQSPNNQPIPHRSPQLKPIHPHNVNPAHINVIPPRSNVITMQKSSHDKSPNKLSTDRNAPLTGAAMVRAAVNTRKLLNKVLLQPPMRSQTGIGEYSISNSMMSVTSHSHSETHTNATSNSRSHHSVADSLRLRSIFIQTCCVTKILSHCDIARIISYLPPSPYFQFIPTLSKQLRDICRSFSVLYVRYTLKYIDYPLSYSDVFKASQITAIAATKNHISMATGEGNSPAINRPQIAPAIIERILRENEQNLQLIRRNAIYISIDHPFQFVCISDLNIHFSAEIHSIFLDFLRTLYWNRARSPDYRGSNTPVSKPQEVCTLNVAAFWQYFRRQTGLCHISLSSFPWHTLTNCHFDGGHWWPLLHKQLSTNPNLSCLTADRRLKPHQSPDTTHLHPHITYHLYTPPVHMSSPPPGHSATSHISMRQFVTRNVRVSNVRLLQKMRQSIRGLTIKKMSHGYHWSYFPKFSELIYLSVHRVLFGHPKIWFDKYRFGHLRILHWSVALIRSESEMNEFDSNLDTPDFGSLLLESDDARLSSNSNPTHQRLNSKSLRKQLGNWRRRQSDPSLHPILVLNEILPNLHHLTVLSIVCNRGSVANDNIDAENEADTINADTAPQKMKETLNIPSSVEFLSISHFKGVKINLSACVNLVGFKCQYTKVNAIAQWPIYDLPLKTANHWILNRHFQYIQCIVIDCGSLKNISKSWHKAIKNCKIPSNRLLALNYTNHKSCPSTPTIGVSRLFKTPPNVGTTETNQTNPPNTNPTKLKRYSFLRRVASLTTANYETPQKSNAISRKDLNDELTISSSDDDDDAGDDGDNDELDNNSMKTPKNALSILRQSFRNSNTNNSNPNTRQRKSPLQLNAKAAIIPSIQQRSIFEEILRTATVGNARLYLQLRSEYLDWYRSGYIQWVYKFGKQCATIHGYSYQSNN